MARRSRSGPLLPIRAGSCSGSNLPSGVPAGGSPYALLSVRARAAADGQPSPVVGLEQFDAAPTTAAIAGVRRWLAGARRGSATGQLWRWTSDRSALVIRGGSGDLTLELAGESPLRYFDRAPTVVVKAGDRELARFNPSGDFTQRVAIPRAALDASGGRVTIETDLTFVPGLKNGGPDRRTLGLKLYRVELRD